MERDETPEVPAWSVREPHRAQRWAQAVLWSPFRAYLWLLGRPARTMAVILAVALWTVAGAVVWLALNQP